MSTTEIGRSAELLAQQYLERRGYQPVCRNYRAGAREIDLIMRDGKYLVFVEVKARSGVAYGTPGAFVTRAKQRLLTLAAETYLMKENALDTPARFDVVEVYLSTGEVKHIENAFDAV